MTTKADNADDDQITVPKTYAYIAAGLTLVVLLIIGLTFLDNGETEREQQPRTAMIGSPAPNAVFTTISGANKQLSAYDDQPTMIWLMATWCPSCQQGARVLQANNESLGDLHIIALKTHNNAGYPGPKPATFAKKYAPQTLKDADWTWGTASRNLTQTYNPRDTPDIIWLVKPNGNIAMKTAAPAARLDQIRRFAQRYS